MTRVDLLSTTIADLCCCSGLAADGYASVFGRRALSGWDIEDQPHYPYRFTRGDVMVLLDPEHPDHQPDLVGFTLLHTSFPCQALTTAGHLRTAQGGKSRFPDLLTPGLELLRRHWSHVPWVVENVDDNQGKARAIMAPRDGEHLVMLCGSMFGLEVQRHRLFLANFPLRQPDPVPDPGKSRSKMRALGCDHDTFPLDPISGKPRPWGVWHVKGDNVPSGGRTALDEEHGRQVMGSHRTLPWDRLKEGFPPAYTSWIAADALVEISRRRLLETA